METQSLARSLKEQPLVADLADQHVAFLSGCTKNVRYDEGEYLFRESDEAEWLYMVRKGKVSLEIKAPQKTLVVETLHSGEVIGWSTIFPPHFWQLDARATKETIVFAVNGQCLRNKLDADHDFGYAFTRLMLREVHGRLERVRLQVLDLYRADS